MRESDSNIDEVPGGGNGLRGRIVGTVLLASLGTALAVGSAGLYAVYSPMRDGIEQTYSRVLAGSSEGLTDLLETARSDIDSIAREPGLRKAILAAVAEPELVRAQERALVEALEGTLARAPRFAGLLALDRLGNTLAVAGGGPPVEGLLERLRSKDPVSSELLEVMQAKQLRSEIAGVAVPIVRSIDVGVALSLAIAIGPVRGPGDQPAASVVGLLRRSGLRQPLHADLLGEGANILVVDELGGLLAAHHGSDAPVSAGSGEAEACSLRLTWTVNRGGAVTCALGLGSSGWSIVAEQSAGAAFQPLVIMVPSLLTTGGIMVIVFSLLAARLAGSTVGPVRALHRGIESVARGDFEIQLEQKRRAGEMEPLILAFNHMVRALGERSRRFNDRQRALTEQNRSFQNKYQSISELSVTDPLTQLHNRRFFETQLQCEVKRLGRKGEGLCLLVIDVDDFKKINDTFGHQAGDEFLKQIATILVETVRATDLVARFGGEEFVVVSTSTNIRGSTILAEKIRTAIAEASFIVDDTMKPRRATVSIGVAAYKGSRTGLFNTADAALYRAKGAGKNCVVADGE